MMNTELTVKRSNLVMPANYAELTEEEMTYVEGGGWFADIFSWLGIVTEAGSIASCLIPGCQALLPAWQILNLVVNGMTVYTTKNNL